jgi:mono/diheme cytochrome c family protein
MVKREKKRWPLCIVATLAFLALPACRVRNEDSAGSNLDHPVAAGRRIFLQKCAFCHGSEGNGFGKKIPPLAGAPWVQGPPSRLTALVLDGLTGKQTIGGMEYAGVMPAWRGVLTDPEIAAVLTYIRQAWGNKSPAISIGLVREIDQRYQARRGFWAPAELKALSPE